MTYQYKAHGVQALGLKRGLDQELVVAPYASFLALPMAPKSAVRNLRRLCALGLEGRFGLYEAADFTPSRLSGGSNFEIVRSYMAHHLGMSLVAIDNALTEDVMQRRFLSDRTMAAYRELLQERVPVGAPVMRRRTGRRRSAPAAARGPICCGPGRGRGVSHHGATWCPRGDTASLPPITDRPAPAWGGMSSPWRSRGSTRPLPGCPGSSPGRRG